MRGALNSAFCLSFTLGMCEAGMASMLVDPSGETLRKLARYWATTLCRGCELAITVEERVAIDWSQPMIVMANHQSHLDIPVLYASLPSPVGIIAKEELFRIPVFGSIMRALRCVAIDRDDPKSARESIERAAGEVRSGKSVLVFPEGTRTRDGQILPLKKGPFHLVEMAGVPVVPIGIRGTNQALAKNSLVVRAADVHVTIGAPIATVGSGQAARETLRKDVEVALIELSSHRAPKTERAIA